MGNCIALLSSATRLNACYGSMEQEGSRKIVNADAKVVEFRTSISVRDLLPESGGLTVGVTRQASHLPPDHELGTGQVLSSLEESSRCRRVKLVLTKQQLQELLLKKVIVEDVLVTLKEMEQGSSLSCSTRWKPQLEAIQEE